MKIFLLRTVKLASYILIVASLLHAMALRMQICLYQINEFVLTIHTQYGNSMSNHPEAETKEWDLSHFLTIVSIFMR